MEHIGIDLHKRESQICILTAEGELIERRIQTARERFTRVLETRAPARILLEASTESEWVAQTIEQLGHEVIVADPNYAPMYPERRRRVKTDRRDARMLAEACQLGGYRPAHRVSAEQRQVRRQLSVRDLLVRARGRTIALPAELQAALRPLVALVTQLTERLATADAQLTQTVAANPVVQQLTTAPGVGPVTVTAFVAPLDEAGRFRGAHQVASYLGLVPSETSSPPVRIVSCAGDQSIAPIERE